MFYLFLHIYFISRFTRYLTETRNAKYTGVKQTEFSITEDGETESTETQGEKRKEREMKEMENGEGAVLMDEYERDETSADDENMLAGGIQI